MEDDEVIEDREIKEVVEVVGVVEVGEVEEIGINAPGSTDSIHTYLRLALLYHF